MSISTTKHHNIGLSELQQQEIITNKLKVKLTRSLRLSLAQSSIPIPKWSDLGKTDAGDKKQISDYGIPFRNSHTIYKYELRQYSQNGSYDVYKDALIVNKNG